MLASPTACVVISLNLIGKGELWHRTTGRSGGRCPDKGKSSLVVVGHLGGVQVCLRGMALYVKTSLSITRAERRQLVSYLTSHSHSRHRCRGAAGRPQWWLSSDLPSCFPQCSAHPGRPWLGPLLCYLSTLISTCRQNIRERRFPKDIAAVFSPIARSLFSSELLKENSLSQNSSKVREKDGN